MAMEIKDVVDRVDAIIAMGNADPEVMHNEEDKLVLEVINAIIDGNPQPRELAWELLRAIGRDDVTRWYA